MSKLAKKIAVVGAGPGGLTAAMILAHRGFDVSVYEKADRVGGRNGELTLGDYRFDIGPTFLMMKFLLDQVFEETGRNPHDYFKVLELDPMYSLDFGGEVFRPSSHPEKLKTEVERIFPGAGRELENFFRAEQTRFKKMYPCLQRDYSSPLSMLNPLLLKALPYLDLGKSMYDILASYFSDDRMRISFTFQSKYLGMSPWTCPAAFMIIPYLEYGFGVYHVQGGLCKISEAMARVVDEEGGKIYTGTPVRRVLVDNGAVSGLELDSGGRVEADAVVLNADFGHAMATLFEPGVIRKWSEANLNRRPFSCSTYMLYLGLDTVYPLDHHTIVFSGDYEGYVDDVTEKKRLSTDISFYIRNSSVNDPDVAPPGHSAVYVLVPVANNFSDIDWDQERDSFRELVLDAMERQGPMPELRRHIVAEEVITPKEWEEEQDVFRGATFNLAHTLTQMMYLRPRNAFEEVDGCFLVGGGTHPGSGLPTIYESGRISANLISNRFGIPFGDPSPPPESRM